METQSRALRPLPLLTLVLLAIAAVLWATGVFGTSRSVGPEEASATDLEPFASCEELRAYARDHRWSREPIPYPTMLMEEAAPATSLSASDASVGASPTGTNVQEAGVDEPDIAKLSGETLFVVERDELRAYEVSGPEPVALGVVALPGSGSTAQLLIAGERALVIEDLNERPEWEPSTRLTEIDITDPNELTPVRELEIEGAQVSARLRGETVHLVLASSPDYRGEGEPAEWLPSATATDLATGETSTGPLFGCESVAYPEQFAGLGLLSVLTLDLSQGLTTSDVDTVITDGSTVYASPSSLYVATQVLVPPDPAVIDRLTTIIGGGLDAPPALPDETTIHRFDTTDPAATSYSSSGLVDGRILNQWSFSEHDGYLRVATTEGDAWSAGANESESAITVLAEEDGVLREIGRVDGLGRGEEIYGVRFVEEMGYVVTFEQTDPLYAVDLSDPESPRATGELKIPGYSAYLHPVGEGRLLGIGQGGTLSGTLTGAQASLFDVSDPDSPQQLATLGLSDDGYGSAATAWDHRAFLFSPELLLAVVPVESYGRDAFTGAVAMQVDAEGGLTELGRLEAGGGPIERVFMIGENLVTLSHGEVASSALAGL